ncbi:MAG: zf-HC2 domain-containing protein [Polyangiaceae bacterium]
MTDHSDSTPSSSPCRKYTHLLGAYVDGELEPSSVLEVDDHVSRCETCGERISLDRAIRGSLKRTVGAAAVPASDALRARIAGAMLAAEKHDFERDAKIQKAQDVARAGVTKSWSWRTGVPLASAAALALVWGAAAHGPIGRSTSNAAVTAGADFDLQDLISEHSHPLPPESTDPKDVRAFEKYVGVPVRPVNFEKRSGARLVGGRMILVRQERAAVLQYELGTGANVRRFSILVYDPTRVRVNDEGLNPRAVGTAEVRVGESSGYTLATAHGTNVGYAVASDLGRDKSAELAALAEE